MITILTKNDGAFVTEKPGKDNIYEVPKLDDMDIRLLVETYILPENESKEKDK